MNTNGLKKCCYGFIFLNILSIQTADLKIIVLEVLKNCMIVEFTWEDHADVSPDDEVEDGVDEQQPAQPTKRGCVSRDGRDVRVAPLNA